MPQMQPLAITNASSSCGSSSSGRGSRRPRGRGGNSGNRRNDYVQRTQQDSPAPQDIVNQQQQIDPQTVAGQYPQYTYQYTTVPGYYGGPPQNHMIHPQAQQTAGPHLYAMQFNQSYYYPSFVYPPMLHQGDSYQIMDDQGDDRQNPQMWHHQHIYPEEYVNHELIAGSEDLNHNAPSLASSETPSMLSPSYQIYESQMQQTIEMQQQMNMMHIYDDQQLQGHPGHLHGQLGQMEDELSDCGPIQMVPAILAPMQLQPDPHLVHHHHHQQHPQHQPPHLIQGPLMAIESVPAVHQQLQPLLEHAGKC